MVKISLRVKVPIVPMEVDQRPSALRKSPPPLGGEPWMARLAYVGGEWRNLVTEWRDRDTSGNIVECQKGGDKWGVQGVGIRCEEAGPG